MQMRSGVLLHVDNDLMRFVAIGCEFGLKVCPDHNKGNYDLATLDLTGISTANLTIDIYPLNYFRVKTTIPDHE